MLRISNTAEGLQLSKNLLDSASSNVRVPRDTLTTAELRDREAKLLAQFRSAVVEAEELEEGYAFRLPGDAK